MGRVWYEGTINSFISILYPYILHIILYSDWNSIFAANTKRKQARRDWLLLLLVVAMVMMMVHSSMKCTYLTSGKCRNTFSRRRTWWTIWSWRQITFSSSTKTLEIKINRIELPRCHQEITQCTIMHWIGMTCHFPFPFPKTNRFTGWQKIEEAKNKNNHLTRTMYLV